MAYIGRDIQYGTLDKQSFTANSSTTAFTLDSSVKDAKSLLVSVGGVIQEPEVAYTASGTALTFSEAPATGNAVYVVYLGKELTSGAERDNITYQTGTGNNTTTPLTLSSAPPNASALMVMLNGVTQRPVTDYTVSGTTLTFTTAVATGVNILVYHLGKKAEIGVINDNAVTDAKIVSMNAAKLTGSLPGNMAVDTTKIDQSIATLGLHIGVSDNKVSYNLPAAFIDTFEDDSGILTETNVDRLTDEYVASTYTSTGAATYWPYTSNATQTIVDGGNNMNGVPAANNWSVINQGSWPTYLGYWMTSFSYASTYLYVDYLAEYRWTGLKISWHAAHSIVATWRLEHSNDGTNWTVMDQTGTTHADWTGQGFTAGHEDIVTGIDTATGVFTNSNPGHSASKGGSIITFGTPVTSRYLRVGVASIHTNLGDPTAALGAFIPQYQSQTTSTNATGTLISKAQTAASTVSTASGIMLYEDAEGTGTLGTDLKVYFSSNDGTNWTEAASYGAAQSFVGTTKMAKLGKTTLANTGTAVKMKAEWANQATAVTGQTITAHGGVKHSTAYKKIDASSICFPNSAGNYLKAANSAGLRFGTSDFCIEFWLYLNRHSHHHTMYDMNYTSAGGVLIQMDNSSNSYIRVWVNGTGGSGAYQMNTGLSLSTWHHLAFVRESGLLKSYLNGTLDAATSDQSMAGNVNATQDVYMGYDAGGQGFNLDGYMDEIRVSNNARYTSNFTPSTTAFTPDANTVMLIHSNHANNSTTFSDSTGVAGKVQRLHGWAVNY